MSFYSKIEIKTIGEPPNVFAEVLIDGHTIHGVRAISYGNGMGEKVPIIRLDLNAFDVSIDSVMNKVDMKRGGEIAEIKFKDGHIAKFE